MITKIFSIIVISLSLFSIDGMAHSQTAKSGYGIWYGARPDQFESIFLNVCEEEKQACRGYAENDCNVYENSGYYRGLPPHSADDHAINIIMGECTMGDIISVTCTYQCSNGA